MRRSQREHRCARAPFKPTILTASTTTNFFLTNYDLTFHPKPINPSSFREKTWPCPCWYAKQGLQCIFCWKFFLFTTDCTLLDAPVSSHPAQKIFDLQSTVNVPLCAHTTFLRICDHKWRDHDNGKDPVLFSSIQRTETISTKVSIFHRSGFSAPFGFGHLPLLLNFENCPDVFRSNSWSKPSRAIARRFLSPLPCPVEQKNIYIIHSLVQWYAVHHKNRKQMQTP